MPSNRVTHTSSYVHQSYKYLKIHGMDIRASRQLRHTCTSFQGATALLFDPPWPQITHKPCKSEPICWWSFSIQDKPLYTIKDFCDLCAFSLCKVSIHPSIFILFGVMGSLAPIPATKVGYTLDRWPVQCRVTRQFTHSHLIKMKTELCKVSFTVFI